MALTDSQKVRLRIQDIPEQVRDTYYGDGTATTFALPHRNLTTASAYVPQGGTAWSATGATFNASGSVAFSGVISASSAYQTVYTHSVFSDTEIDQFLADGGTIIGASLEALGALLFDGIKRARWAAADGTSYDDTQAMVHLRELYGILKAEQKEETAASGGDMMSWAEQQEWY